MSKRVDLFQAPAWVALMGKQVRAAAERGLYSAALRTVQHIVTEVIPREPRVPVDRGLYRAGWRAARVPGGAVVVNSTPHAAFIEHGVRGANVKPGRKMIEALAEWALRKGLVRKGADATLAARQVAWAIATSMQRRGIFDGGKGLGILAKATRRIPQFIDEEVRREIARGG